MYVQFNTANNYCHDTLDVISNSAEIVLITSLWKQNTKMITEPDGDEISAKFVGLTSHIL